MATLPSPKHPGRKAGLFNNDLHSPGSLFDFLHTGASMIASSVLANQLIYSRPDSYLSVLHNNEMKLVTCSGQQHSFVENLVGIS